MSSATRLSSSGRRRRGLSQLTWCATLLTAPAVADADAPDQNLPLVLAYAASSGCPDEASFRSEVELRLQRSVTWLSEGNARKVTVRIDERSEGVRGELEFTLANRDRTSREVIANTCAEVASGLALVVALAIDEEAARAEPARLAIERQPPPRAPLAKQPAPGPTRIAPRLELHAGPALGTVKGPAPVALVTWGATFAARYDTATWASPTVYLTPLYGKTGVSGPEAALASFTWATLGIEACPALARLTRSIGVLACAASHLGTMIVEAEPDEIQVPTHQQRFWADAGLSLRLELAWRSWFADLSAAGLVVLTRDAYVFTTPDVLVHSVPNFAYSGLFTLGFSGQL